MRPDASRGLNEPPESPKEICVTLCSGRMASIAIGTLAYMICVHDIPRLAFRLERATSLTYDRDALVYCQYLTSKSLHRVKVRTISYLVCSSLSGLHRHLTTSDFASVLMEYKEVLKYCSCTPRCLFCSSRNSSHIPPLPFSRYVPC